MQIKDVMTTVPGYVDVNSILRDASATMKSLHLEHIPVLDHGTFVGVLSETSILSVIAHDGLAGAMRRAQDIMLIDVPRFNPDQSLEEAAQRLRDAPVTASLQHYPVLDEGQKLVGLVSPRALRASNSPVDEGSTHSGMRRTRDVMSSFDEDPVRYMGDESFPASDPLPPQSTVESPTDDRLTDQ